MREDPPQIRGRPPRHGLQGPCHVRLVGKAYVESDVRKFMRRSHDLIDRTCAACMLSDFGRCFSKRRAELSGQMDRMFSQRPSQCRYGDLRVVQQTLARLREPGLS